MNEVPEGTLPRSDPPPPLPPKIGDESDIPSPVSLPPKPPRHGGGSKRAPPSVPAPYNENTGTAPPLRPPKSHG